MKLDQSITIYCQSQTGEVQPPVQLPPSSDAALRPLLKACEPAGFGRGKDEVGCIDERAAGMYPQQACMLALLRCPNLSLNDISNGTLPAGVVSVCSSDAGCSATRMLQLLHECT